MYTDLPAGQYGLCQMWSGDAINTPVLPAEGHVASTSCATGSPRTAGARSTTTWSSASRRGRTRWPRTSSSTTSWTTRSPRPNFGFTGYQPPLTAFTPETLVAEGYVPENLATAVVHREGLHDRGAAAAAAAGRGHGVPPDLAGVQGRWLSGARAAGPAGLWPLLALPGIVWLAVLLVAPLYVVLAILFGGVDPILRQPVPVWNPFDWDVAQFELRLAAHRRAGRLLPSRAAPHRRVRRRWPACCAC